MEKYSKDLKKIGILVLIVCIVVVLVCSSFYYLDIYDGSYKEGKKSNTPYAVKQYTSNVNIDSNGNVAKKMTAQELWEQMLKDGSRVDAYLSGPEELQKLINAEMVTDYLDTRPDPNAEINWEELNADVNSTMTQGIVKLKRANEDGTTSTLTYTDSETFQMYINKYNETGSEEDKQMALKYFTLEKEYKVSSVGNVGIIYGNGTFTKYNLTEEQLRKIANLCKQEQGTPKGAAAEASLMANLFELKGSEFGTGGDGLYNYVRNSGWFAHAADNMDNGNADSNYIDVVRAVLVNGKRTLPGYIDEHDCFSDITITSNNTNTIDKKDRSKYVQHITKISNVYGSEYTFFGFPDTNSDPFGYKSEENRKKIGDFYYDFETGEEINKQGNFTNISTNTNTGTESVEQEALYWPTDGTKITSYFGPRKPPTEGASTNHGAVDIGVPIGTNVYATEAGTVTTAGYSSSAGNWIVIDHGNGYVSKYMHNSKLIVKAGDIVTKGQHIAYSGNTGNSTGPHLHFGIEFNGTPVDPLTFKYNNGMGNGQGGVGSDISGLSTTSTIYAKVATWNEVTEIIQSDDPSVETTDSDGDTTYNMMSTKVNYQELVSGYKMPFDYLWALVVISQDKDFVFELAELVYDSEIEITVHDNLSINTNVFTETYTKITKVVTDKVKVGISYQYNPQPSTLDQTTNQLLLTHTTTEEGGPFEDEIDNQYKTTHTIITKTNTLNTALTKADVWIVNYTQEFTKQEQPATPQGSSQTTLKNEEYPENEEKKDNVDTAGLAENYRQTVQSKYEARSTGVKTTVKSLESKYYYKKVDRISNISNTLETTQYSSSPAIIEEKTDKNSTEDNFVTIFIRNGKARSNIISARVWLFEILESSPEAVDMIDLTKYLMYKATETDYGVTQFDFNIFDPANFKTITGMYGNSIEERVWWALIDAGYTKEATAGVMGNLYKESGFKTNNLEERYNEILGYTDESYTEAVNNGTYTLDKFISDHQQEDCGAGYGLAQWTYFNRKEGLYKFAKSRGVSIDDESMQIEYLLGEISQSGGADGYATCQLSSYNGYTIDDWKNATTPEVAAEAFCWIFEKPTDYNSERGTKAREYYDKFKNATKPAGGQTQAASGDGYSQVYTSSTGRTYKEYKQWKGSYAGYTFAFCAPGTISNSGCSITAVAVVTSGYNNNQTPGTLASRVPTLASLLTEGGAQCTGYESADVQRLTSGRPALVNISGTLITEKGSKYYGTHFVAILDARNGNEVYVSYVGASDAKCGGWTNVQNIINILKHDKSVLYVNN